MFNLNESVDYDGEESVATSNSSVVNDDAAMGGGGTSNAGDDDTGSAHDRFTFNFDILKVGTADTNKDKNRELTRQLFPETRPDHTGISGQAEGAIATSSRSNKDNCFNLSFRRNGPSGPKIMNAQQEPQQQQQVKKSRRGPRSRSSQYRGVTFYRRTGRWESHIWDCGKQVYLGGFDTAHVAARAYDKAAIKFRGVDADINFHINDYEQDMKLMKDLSKEEFVHILRRRSTGFSRGSSKYRGVTLHKCGRWEARMGQFLGKKAYDKAAIKYNGRDAITNFEPNTYESEMASGLSIEGSQHDLDLNLGISALPPAKSADNSSSTTVAHPPFKELHFAPDYPHFSTVGRPNSFPNCEGPQGTEQMHDRVSSNPTTTFFNAASSGFPSPATNVLSAFASSANNPYQSSFNFCFTSFPTASTNASQGYYHHIKPPPP